jgi:hypothetical protein
MINCISVGFMRIKIGLLVGLGTALLLFLSTYGISSVNGQQTDPKDSSIDNKTGNPDSGSQTNLDPFMSRGSNGNTNTGNGDDASLTDDGSTTDGDGSGSTTDGDGDGSGSTTDGDGDGSGSTTDGDDGSGSTTKDDDSDSSKSSEQDKDSKSDDDGKKFELPFP